MEDGVQYGDTLLPLTENETNWSGRRHDVSFRTPLPEIEEPPESSARPGLDASDEYLPADVAELRDAVGAMSAASARTLRAVGRCAEKRRFAELGFRSMTDFLSTVFPIGLATAKEWVFLSKKVRELPAIFRAFEAGRLTWEQLRPLARFAERQTDEHWAEAAPQRYPAQLYRELQRRTRPKLRDERTAHASRYLRLVWDSDDPVVYIEGRLGKEQGSRLEQAIIERSREIPPDPGADDPSEARRVDALVELATGAGGGADGSRAAGRSGGGRRDTLVVHIDLATLRRTKPRTGPWLAETGSGRTLHPETIRRIGCDADVDLLYEKGPLSVGIGRKSPRVPGWLERAVRHRDGGICAFPACERRISLLSHHIRHWADGGTTDLDNLVTLCSTHHRYVHEDGWRIAREPTGDLRFHDPTGRLRARASTASPGRRSGTRRPPRRWSARTSCSGTGRSF